MMIKFVMFNGTSVINSSRIYINFISFFFPVPPMQWLSFSNNVCVCVCVVSIFSLIADDDVGR